MTHVGLSICTLLILHLPKLAQAQVATDSSRERQSLPPATKLEAFQPTAGRVSTLAYDELGRISPGLSISGDLSVDVRQVSSVSDTSRGVVVEIGEGSTPTVIAIRRERSFVDEDELSELISGIDALLSVRDNPTPFKQFEVSYRTRGDLVVTAFNQTAGGLRYSITVGRVFTARRSINENELKRFREWIVSAKQKLDGLPN